MGLRRQHMNRFTWKTWTLVPVALLAALLLVRQGEAADKPAKKKPPKPETTAPAAKINPGDAAKNTRDLAGRIDKLIDAKLLQDKVPASPQADDAEFLRRVSLDITGVIPSAERTKEFLDSKDGDKRGKLIDELLASAEYGKHQADVWQDLLL